MPYQVNLRLFKFFSEPTKHNHLRSSFGSRTLFLARKSSSDRDEMRPSSSSLPNAFLVLLLSMIKSKLQCTVKNSREVKCICLRYMYLYICFWIEKWVIFPSSCINICLSFVVVPTLLFCYNRSSCHNTICMHVIPLTHANCVILFMYCLLQSA